MRSNARWALFVKASHSCLLTLIGRSWKIYPSFDPLMRSNRRWNFSMRASLSCLLTPTRRSLKTLWKRWPTDEDHYKMDPLCESFLLLPFDTHRGVSKCSLFFDSLMRSNERWTLCFESFLTLASWHSQGGIWRLYEDVDSLMRFNARWTLFREFPCPCI